MLNLKYGLWLLAVAGLSALLPAQQQKPAYTYKAASAYGKGKFYQGREIAQVMSFEGAAWLERNDRQQ